MPTATERLETAVSRVETDSSLFHQIVHGDENTVVTTENGPVNSVAKTLAELGGGGGGGGGGDGDKGWSPSLAIVTDGARRVLQITDWVGGEGVKPSVVNQFIGATSIVSSAAAAVDIRGPQGATGPSGSGSGDMLKSVYDPNDDGKVTAAVNADAAPWAGVTGKPTTFPP